jgi:hypothetical protein
VGGTLPYLSGYRPLRECVGWRDQRPLRERLPSVARASEGAGDECRSDEQTHLETAVSSIYRAGVCEARRTSRRPAPMRERNLNQKGEAPVKYELTGAS